MIPPRRQRLSKKRQGEAMRRRPGRLREPVEARGRVEEIRKTV